ncbi:MAG TPA: SpoIIE family protein phosphatase, partial [Acidimicrobiales bacterium]|nr:SpoIIE family protein phosphatase [Acidimicrobiales bacterium]
SFTIEHRVLMSDGSTRWVRGNGRVVRDEDGKAVGMIGVSADITARAEAEYTQAVLFAAEQEARAEAEAARDRLAFLAEASEVLSSSLDYRATLSQVAHLAVSRLADWCSVDVVEEEGDAFTTVVVAHVDPAKVAMAQNFRDRYPPDPDSDQGVAGVIRSGEPQMTPVINDEMLAAAAVDDEHLQLLRDLGLSSALVVPLIARGRTLGALTMISAESGRMYGDADMALAMDLARRAALAIDNALLFRERSQVAEALQASLLPPRRPEIPGMEVAVRYRPVGRGTEIGGDFYDVFETTPGQWSVVIGDVCGKGTAAAALTGLARDTIRGVSIHEASPQRVLRVLNEVVLRREDESRFLTVALARVEPLGNGTGGGGARLTIACAGHPPGLVIRSDGSVEEVGKPALLVGLFPEVDPVDVEVELAPGEALVLYTDGVVEEQGPAGMFGEERLHDLLAEVGPADAETVAQAVLDAVAGFAPGPPQDDVAIVVLRA